MTDQCCRCRFWREDKSQHQPNDPDWGFGDCRRKPPRVIESYVAALMPRPEYGQQTDPEIGTAQMTTASLFPATFATDWCGQFQSNGALMPALVERNAIYERADGPDRSNEENQRDCTRLGELEETILRSPAVSKDDLLAKLLLATQFNVEGSYLPIEEASPLVREAKAMIGVGLVELSSREAAA